MENIFGKISHCGLEEEQIFTVAVFYSNNFNDVQFHPAYLTQNLVSFKVNQPSKTFLHIFQTNL